MIKECDVERKQKYLMSYESIEQILICNVLRAGLEIEIKIFDFNFNFAYRY